jgi:methylenetetrahydrofolate reductase (NADPH)
MKLRDIYAQPGLTLSIEFFPPKTPKGESDLLREIEVLKGLNPSFCSVTYGAGGSTRDKTVDLVTTIRRDIGVEVMCHLTVVGQSRDEVRAVLERLKAKGIENIIALAGDPPPGITDWSPHPDGFHYSFELVEEARSHNRFSGFPKRTRAPKAAKPTCAISKRRWTLAPTR